MNPTFLPPAMSKQRSRLGSLTLIWHLVKEKENQFRAICRTLDEERVLPVCRDAVNVYLHIEDQRKDQDHLDHSTVKIS